MGQYGITGRDMTQQKQYDLITNLIPLLNLAQLFYLSLSIPYRTFLYCC